MRWIILEFIIAGGNLLIGIFNFNNGLLHGAFNFGVAGLALGCGITLMMIDILID